MESILLSQAAEILQQNCTGITDTETTSLLKAEGRILAEDIDATMDQPPFARSPLDGYALRADDTAGATRETPVSLKVVGEVMAGDWCEICVTEGTAVRIMTGAPIPKGADCILKQEDSDYGMDTVRIFGTLRPWQNYSPAGKDYRKGTRLISEGTRLGAVEIGVLAGMGIQTVRVYRRPRVLLMSTGSELADPDKPLGPGQIYDSNMHMLRAQLLLWGMEVTAAAIIRDDPAAACAFIEENADRSDLILTTGGASVGKKDIMHDVVRLLPTDQLFWKVRLKPGSPSIAALYGGKLLIALSGNPYGAIANLHLLVRPVLAVMAHRPDLRMQMRTAIYDTGFSKKSPVTRYVRGVYEAGHVRSFDSNESGVLASMIGCNCMIVVPAGDKGVDPGETVDILML